MTLTRCPPRDITIRLLNRIEHFGRHAVLVLFATVLRQRAFLVQAEHNQFGEIGIGNVKLLVNLTVDGVVALQEQAFLLQVLLNGLFGGLGHELATPRRVPVAIQRRVTSEGAGHILVADVVDLPVSNIALSARRNPLPRILCPTQRAGAQAACLCPAGV